MLCDICKAEEACVTFTEIKDGQQVTRHLCKECAIRYATADSQQVAILPGTILAALFAEVLRKSRENESLTIGELKKTNFVCQVCGTTFDEFLKQAEAGCRECYRTFGMILDSYLDELQGAHQHTGRGPEGLDLYVDIPEFKTHVGLSDTDFDRIEIERLQQKLDQAIAEEDFEAAAQLRDQIHEKKVNYESICSE